MGPVFYVLAILGCGEGEASCQQIAMAPASYQSVDACHQATEGERPGPEAAQPKPRLERARHEPARRVPS